MDASRFDPLLRALTTSPSRRVTLRVLGGVGLASLFHLGDTAAKRRKKRKKKKRRKKEQGGCTPASPDLSNGSCATVCDTVDDCPPTCPCSLASAEGARHCVQAVNDCAAVPQPCTSTAECPPGQHCSLIGCGPGNTLVNRCRPLCPLF